MGYYDDHMKCVATYMVEYIQKGKKRETIKKHLLWCGWTEEETEKILKMAYKFAEDKKELDE